ncbi:MAG: DsbA family protein [Sporolactobacillus sp.]
MSGNDQDHSSKGNETKEVSMKRRIVVFSSVVVILLIAAIFYMIFSDQQKNQVRPHKKTVTHKVVQASPMDYNGHPFIGSTNVPVRIAVFSDYRCPYCKLFDQQILPQIEKEYVKSDKVSIYFYNYTILGPGSTLAANASAEVYQQNPKAFFAFHQALFNAQGSEKKQWVTKKLLTNIAKKTVPSLDMKAFQNALDTKSRQQDVDNDNQLAESLGVQGTPTILINGKINDNALELGKLKQAINQALPKE